MNTLSSNVIVRILIISLILLGLLAIVMVAGLSIGSTGSQFLKFWHSILSNDASDSTFMAIVWKIRFPRVLLAAFVGAALSIGGLVFQALLKNPLAEPYILGISGGAAIGAIIGILLGLSRYPGISFLAFCGSSITLLAILTMSYGQAVAVKDTLLLSGVMVNAFCTAVIMFLISMTQDARLHNIMFWLMGDLSALDLPQVGHQALILIPCFIILFSLSNAMNLLQLGNDMALTMGVNIKSIMLTLLIITSFMISITVSNCGLVGFVGLVVPHIFRLILGPDHRVLVPACLFGGAAYMVACDLLARILPNQGEMPVGVITAIIGAPIFIILLRKNRNVSRH